MILTTYPHMHARIAAFMILNASLNAQLKIVEDGFAMVKVLMNMVAILCFIK